VETSQELFECNELNLVFKRAGHLNNAESSPTGIIQKKIRKSIPGTDNERKKYH